MLDLIKNNYKIILLVILMLIVIPTMPVLLEILFKFGNIVGTYIRLGNGVCI